MISDYKKTKSFKKLISENSQLYVPINTTDAKEGYAITNPENQEVIGWCSNVEGTDGFYHNTKEIVKIIYNAFSKSDEKVQDIKFINTTR